MVGGGGIDSTRDRAETDTEAPGGVRTEGVPRVGSLYDSSQHTNQILFLLWYDPSYFDVLEGQDKERWSCEFLQEM